MNGDKKTVEISLKEFLIVILRNWLPLVLVSIVISIGYGYYTYGTLTKSAEEQFHRFEIEKEANEASIQTTIQAIQDLRQRLEADIIYNSESILMQVDPYDKKSARLSFSVYSTPPSQDIRMFMDEVGFLNEQVLNMYYEIINSANLTQLFDGIVSKQYKEEYLKELVAIDKTLNGSIQLYIIGTDDIDPMKLVDRVYEYIENEHNRVSELIIEHKLILTGKIFEKTTDYDLAQFQTKRKASLADANNQIKKLDENLKKMRSQSPSTPNIKKGVLINFVISFVISSIILSLVFVANYVVQLQIQTQSQVQAQLGIRYLGGGLMKKGILFGKWADRLSGADRLASDSDVKSLIYSNIAELIDNQSCSVLVSGTLSEEDIAGFVSELNSHYSDQGIHFVTASNLANNSTAIDLLRTSQYVLFVERIGVSRLKRINQNIARVGRSDKEILGYILI